MENNNKNEQNEQTEKLSSQKPLLLLTIGHGLTHWYPATFFILLPLIGTELGLSYMEIGFIMTFKAISSMLFNFPGGMLADIVNKRGYLLTLALFWVGIPYLLMGFAKSYWLILICLSLVGFGNTLWHPTAMPMLSQLYPNRKGLALSIHSMGANAGDALAPLAMGALLVTISWRQVVVINVLPGIAMAILFLLLLRNTTIIENTNRNKRMLFPEYFKGVKSLIKNKGLIFLSLTAGFRTMSQVTLNTFLPLYLAHQMGFSIFLVGVALFVFQAAGFAAAPLAGYFSDVVGRRKVLIFCMTLTFVVLLLMALIGESIIFIALVAGLGFFLYALRPVLQAWLYESTPKDMGGTSTSVMFGMQSFFSSFAPVLAGIVADFYGLFAVFYFVAGTIMISNILVYFMPDDWNQDQKSSIPG